MRSLLSVIFKILGVAALCVITYLVIHVLGEADAIIESYEELTGNSIGATSSIKVAFLRDYISHTGNTDILITLGVTPAETELILSENNFGGVSPDDETQTPGEPEGNTQDTEEPGNTGATNGSESGGNSGDSGSSVGSEPPVSTGGNTSGSTGSGTGITSGSNPGFMKQGDPIIAQIKGGSGNATMSNAGCGITALYNAYYANTSNPISMKEMLLRYSMDKLGGAVREDSNGNLQGRIGSLSEGEGLWNWMISNYYNPGPVKSGGGTVNGTIKDDGTYIVYFNHADSGQHWVYATKSGNIWKVQNANYIKEGENIGNLTLRKYYKIS